MQFQIIKKNCSCRHGRTCAWTLFRQYLPGIDCICTNEWSVPSHPCSFLLFFLHREKLPFKLWHPWSKNILQSRVYTTCQFQKENDSIAGLYCQCVSYKHGEQFKNGKPLEGSAFLTCYLWPILQCHVWTWQTHHYKRKPKCKQTCIKFNRLKLRWFFWHVKRLVIQINHQKIQRAKEIAHSKNRHGFSIAQQRVALLVLSRRASKMRLLNSGKSSFGSNFSA